MQIFLRLIGHAGLYIAHFAVVDGEGLSYMKEIVYCKVNHMVVFQISSNSTLFLLIHTSLELQTGGCTPWWSLMWLPIFMAQENKLY